MRFFYSTIVLIYAFIVKIFAITGNHKAKLWIDGRKNLYEKYKKHFQNQLPNSYLWMHVSSLGEFEQGRPIIEAIKKNNPQQKILLTFFSPSGYEIRKDYSNVDVVLYLPVDRLKTMRKFVNLVSPSNVIFVKYDFWFNFMKVCFDKKIPVYFISSVFRKNQYFFKWWACWFFKHLKKVDAFFVQTQDSLQILNNKGINNVLFAGDTRLDRVISMKQEDKSFSEIEKIIKGKKVLIAGSTWQKDENYIIPWVKSNNDIFLIIAPHNVSLSRIENIESKFEEKTIRFSQINNNSVCDSRIVIIDSIGILAYLYRYADVVLIGNGFGKGIHNILEPIVFGKPVFFGPNYSKFSEAVTLVKTKGVFSFSNYQDFSKIINKLIEDKDFYYKASKECLKYVEEHKGATDVIISHILNKKD